MTIDIEKIKRSKCDKLLKEKITKKFNADKTKKLKVILNEIAAEDIKRISGTIQTDKNLTVYKYDNERKVFVGTNDKDGKEWLMGVETECPAVWHYCPTPKGTTPKGYPITCGTPIFALITQHGEKVTCPKCKKESTIDVVLPKESKAYELLEMLNQEG